MKVTTYLSFAVFAIQTLQTPAAGSACSSGIYAALAPLETYPPAVTYCKGQAGKSTVTTVVTAASALRRRAVAKTTSIKASKTTTSSSKSSTSAKSTTDTRAAAWSSLVQQAEGIVSTFCSCAGYPAVVTVRLHLSLKGWTNDYIDHFYYYPSSKFFFAQFNQYNLILRAAIVMYQRRELWTTLQAVHFGFRTVEPGILLLRLYDPRQ